MASFSLKNDETTILDLGNSNGLSATNVSNQNANFYLDYERDGHWHSIFGEQTLTPGQTFSKTKREIGHDRVRAGAKGKDDGTNIITGQY